MLEPITRKEAKALGLTRYFTGKRCTRGHVAERKVVDGHCIMCAKDQRRRGAEGFHTLAESRALFDKQNGLCANPLCHASLAISCEEDHILPIKLGGSNYIENIQLLCRTCNAEKSAKHPDKWRRDVGLHA